MDCCVLSVRIRQYIQNLRASATEWNKAPEKEKSQKTVAQTNDSNHDPPRKWRELEPTCDEWNGGRLQSRTSGAKKCKTHTTRSQGRRGRGHPAIRWATRRMRPLYSFRGHILTPTSSLGEGFCIFDASAVKWLCLLKWYVKGRMLW